MDKYAPTSPPAIELSEFTSIPQLGLGVWQIENDKVVPTVTAALEAGYRLIDTAQGYDNEQGVGEAIKSSTVERSEIFVTSKLRTKAMGHEGALAGVRESLAALQLDYLDLMLIHWPTPAHDKYVETWKGLIEAKEQGLVKAIGVSNFTIEQLERIIGETGIVPAVDQVETHPHFQQKGLLPHLAARGIRHEAYSPLGSGEVLDDPIIGEIAASLGKSPAQVIIRWHLQRGSIVIPKSETPERIRENFDVFGFTLSDGEMGRIAGLDDPTNGRTGSDPETFNDLY
ncbi:aldo/keto reductase [Devosia sp. LjRoot16]|jgi:2,5-diketo-D-gluconate reductase A|uniref:aldo/keto reductase n=1 Tax=Devosia sp. LjRoot16 TaxID=3342271 RepID=UPI003ED076A9